MVMRFFFAVPWVCLRFVIVVVFPDHTHLLFLMFSFITDNSRASKQVLGPDYL